MKWLDLLTSNPFVSHNYIHVGSNMCKRQVVLLAESQVAFVMHAL